MNILQKIFTDHYEEIKYTMHTRPVVMDNIDRMIKLWLYIKNPPNMRVDFYYSVKYLNKLIRGILK